MVKPFMSVNMTVTSLYRRAVAFPVSRSSSLTTFGRMFSNSSSIRTFCPSISLLWATTSAVRSSTRCSRIWLRIFNWRSRTFT